MRSLKGLGFSFKISSSVLSMTNADRILPGTDSVVKLLEWAEETMLEKTVPNTDIGIYMYIIQYTSLNNTKQKDSFLAYLNSVLLIIMCNIICF